MKNNIDDNNKKKIKLIPIGIFDLSELDENELEVVEIKDEIVTK